MNLYRKSKGECLVTRLVKFGSVLVVSGYALCANAVVIRHDVEDELYQKHAQSREEFAAEGVLIYENTPIASVTLISPQAVITSAYASDEATELQRTQILFDGSSRTYSVKRWEKHPLWVPGTSEKDGSELFMLGFDFAIGILEEEVCDIKPAILFDRSVHGTEEGKVTTIVSHGGTGDGRMGCQTIDYLKRAGTSTIEFFDHFAFRAVEDPYFECIWRLYFTEFKHPEMEVSLIERIHSVQGNDDYIRPKSTDLECSFNRGDSGAPSFINVEGQEVLAGICSFTVEYIEPDFIPGTGKYGNLCGYGAVAAVSDWIHEVLGSVNQ